MVVPRYTTVGRDVTLSSRKMRNQLFQTNIFAMYNHVIFGVIFIKSFFYFKFISCNLGNTIQAKMCWIYNKGPEWYFQ